MTLPRDMDLGMTQPRDMDLGITQPGDMDRGICHPREIYPGITQPRDMTRSIILSHLVDKITEIISVFLGRHRNPFPFVYVLPWNSYCRTRVHKLQFQPANIAGGNTQTFTDHFQIREIYD